MVFDRIDAVERERREQRRADNGLAHGRDRGRVLVAQKMAAQPRLGALGVFEFNDARALDGLFPHAEKPGGHLRDHVVFIRDEAFRVSSLAGAAEGVPGLCGPDLGQLGPDIGGTERHAAAVPGHIDRYFRPRVIFPFVKKQFRGDVFAPQPGRDFFREHETKPVKPAARIADLAFQMRRRFVACFGHEPVACQKIRGPAIIAQRLENRAFVKRKGLTRAVCDAEAACLFAIRPDASVIERTDHLPVAGRPDVDAIATGLNAFSAGNARRRAMDGIFPISLR